MRRREDKFPDNGFEAWGGYMQAKIAKLEEQFDVGSDKEEKLTNIFYGVSIYVNGFTIPSADELKILMSRHGGIYHTYQRSEDFIVASNLPDTKVKNMSLSRVVRPEWITNSITCQRLLDYRDYLLYKNSRTQLQLNFKKNKRDVSSANQIVAQTINVASNHHTDDGKQIVFVSSEDSIIQHIISEPLSVSTSNTITSTELPVNLTSIDRQNANQKTKTAADPNFITEFYSNSRLHHISQLGACFKQHVNDLREYSKFIFPARVDMKNRISALCNSSSLLPLKFERNKIIMHIDMDCFFVSVGLRNRPHLKGKPVAVTHSKGGQGRPKRPGVDRSVEFNLYKQKQVKKLGIASGQNIDDIESRVDNITDEDDKYGSMSEIASCSYEARSKGVGNGMFMGAALRLCPDLQTIPYDFEGYKEVAYALYNTVAQYTLDIEAVSCDEMYVDCTELLTDMNISAQDFATVLREEIKTKTGCPCSTGFGGNRLQARLATKRAKPDGQFFLTEELIEDFMFEIKLKDLPGVGRQTAHKLESLGHNTCGSLQNLTLATLKSHLGNKTGAQLFDQCRGRDLNPLIFHTVRKSVSAEVNYGIRFDNNNQCIEFLKQLSAELHSRMKQFKVVGKCITLKLMVRNEEAPVETAKFMGHGFCNVINKSVNLTNATNDIDIITREVLTLCKKQNVDCKEMRGIGIQVTKLEQINRRTVIGGIDIFFSHNPVIKHEVKFNNDPVLNTVDTNAPIKSECVQGKPSTPKKVVVNISPKKSPLMSVKSPTSKRRGRPPKTYKAQQKTNNKTTTKSLMSKFLNGQSTNMDTQFKDPMIKQEIIHKSVETKTEETNRLLGLAWDKVRELLRAWLESGLTPLPCDISMIVVYLQEMVVNKNIEKLHNLMRFLKRMTQETLNNDWFEVCEHITEQVQNAMVAVYGKKLNLHS